MWGFVCSSRQGKRLVQSLCRVQKCRKSTVPKLEGMVVAPFTAFDNKRELEDSLYERCVQYFEKSHFVGMFVNGTLGEGMNMSNKERMYVAEKWKQAAGRLFIILHIGAGNLKETQELAKHAEQLEVDAIASLPPTYHKPSSEDKLVAYLEEVAEAAPNTPLLYYEYAQTTGVHLSMPKFLDLASSKLPTLYGLKHTTPDLNSALNCSTIHNERYKVFYGTETQYLPTLSLGIPDIITSPYMGKCFYQIKAAFKKGEIKAAQELQKKAQALINIQFRHGGGIPCAKAMFEIVSGIPVGPPRLPLQPASEKTRESIMKDLKREGFWSDQCFTEEDYDTILLTY